MPSWALRRHERLLDLVHVLALPLGRTVPLDVLIGHSESPFFVCGEGGYSTYLRALMGGSDDVNVEGI